MSDKVLLVGFACIEVCLFCKCYPKTEDTCHRWTKTDLADLGVEITNCPKVEKPTPISHLILSDETGSRTIFVWYPENWTEPKFEDFLKLDLNEYNWVHFEGRNENEIKKMISHLREWNESRDDNKKITISVEIEKSRESMHDLIPLGDVVIFSKEFAWYDGLKNMEEVIEKYKTIVRPTATIVVPWGELGATSRSPDGTTFVQPSFPPKKIVDSVGAGDTFIAALIAALSRKQSVQEATTFACRVAGAKVGIMGYESLLDALSASTVFAPYHNLGDWRGVSGSRRSGNNKIVTEHFLCSGTATAQLTTHLDTSLKICSGAEMSKAREIKKIQERENKR